MNKQIEETNIVTRAPAYCSKGHRTLDWTPGCSVCLQEGLADVLARHGHGFTVEVHSAPS